MKRYLHFVKKSETLVAFVGKKVKLFSHTSGELEKLEHVIEKK